MTSLEDSARGIISGKGTISKSGSPTLTAEDRIKALIPEGKKNPATPKKNEKTEVVVDPELDPEKKEAQKPPKAQKDQPAPTAEETQVDEVSKAMAKSYLDKAVDDAVKQQRIRAKTGSAEASKRIAKRNQGIGRAFSRSIKESSPATKKLESVILEYGRERLRRLRAENGGRVPTHMKASEILGYKKTAVSPVNPAHKPIPERSVAHSKSGTVNRARGAKKSTFMGRIHAAIRAYREH